jgi:hypothetical protein
VTFRGTAFLSRFNKLMNVMALLRSLLLLTLFCTCVPAQLHAQLHALSILVTEVKVPTTENRSVGKELRALLQTKMDSLTESRQYGSLSGKLAWRVTDERAIMGMAKKFIRRFALKVTFYDTVLEEEFGSITLSVTGSGLSKAAAAINALEKLEEPQGELAEAVAKAQSDHQKIIANCTELLPLMHRLISEHRTADLLALSNHISPASACYSEANTLTGDVYQAQQARECSQLIRAAKLQLVAGNIVGASRILSRLDPELDCDEKADELVDQLLEKATAAELQPLDWHLRYRAQNYDRYAARRYVISQLVLKSVRND